MFPVWPVNWSWSIKLEIVNIEQQSIHVLSQPLGDAACMLVWQTLKTSKLQNVDSIKLRLYSKKLFRYTFWLPATWPFFYGVFAGENLIK